MRGDLPAQLHHTQILDDKGINAKTCRRADDLGGLSHFLVGNEDIQGQMDLYATDMAVADGLAQLFHIKILGVSSGVEVAVSKIHRIGSVLYGGTQRLHRTGGSK